MIHIEFLVVKKISPYNGLAKAQEKSDSYHANIDEQLRSYSLKEANDYGVPSVALLEPNHAIYEAMPTIYSKNNLILPVASLAAKSFENRLNTSEKGLLIYSLEVKLNFAGVDPADKKAIYDNSIGQLQDSVLQHPYKASRGDLSDEYAEWVSEFHMDCKEALEKAWKRKVSPIFEDAKLDELKINLSGVCCPHGCYNCCKIYLRALWPFQPGFAHGLEHKNIKLIGIEDLF